MFHSGKDVFLVRTSDCQVLRTGGSQGCVYMGSLHGPRWAVVTNLTNADVPGTLDDPPLMGTKDQDTEWWHLPKDEAGQINLRLAVETSHSWEFPWLESRIPTIFFPCLLLLWQTSHKKQFEKGRIESASGWREESIMTGKAWWNPQGQLWRQAWEATDHCSHCQEAGRGECGHWVWVLLSPFLWVWDQPMGRSRLPALWVFLLAYYS